MKMCDVPIVSMRELTGESARSGVIGMNRELSAWRSEQPVMLSAAKHLAFLEAPDPSLRSG
jgi:hypothetical protein